MMAGIRSFTVTGMTPAVLARLKAAVDASGWVDDPGLIAPHLVEERGLYRGEAAFMLRPATTAAVAAITRICADAKLPIAVQGGNTGLVGGGVPGAGGPGTAGAEVLVNLGRLDKIRALDAANHAITVEAGCILANLQAKAAEAGFLFPLSLASEGSCQIGGNLATNAGGNGVLRYGTMRDLVLGLEVVLPDGRVWDGLRSLRKDNTGYALKHLFIGAEGTLGIITAAVLKLFPLPRSTVTAFVAVATPADAVALLGRARKACSDLISAFELVPRIGIELVTRHIPGTRDPFPVPHPNYVLIEVSSARADDPGPRQALEAVLAEALEGGMARDAVIAESEAQARHLWKLRDELSPAQKREGACIKHDVSVPVSSLAAFIAEATKAVTAILPGIRVVAFGHIGDGNVHFNLSQPEGSDPAAYLARWGEFNRVVHDITVGMNGSISAEHGIGRLKRAELAHYRTATELDLMRAVKRAIDPENRMNPGRIL